jgi:hypothetical protein
LAAHFRAERARQGSANNTVDFDASKRDAIQALQKKTGRGQHQARVT